MSQETEILERKLAEVLAEIDRLKGQARGLVMAIEVLTDERPGTAVPIQATLGEPRPADCPYCKDTGLLPEGGFCACEKGVELRNHERQVANSHRTKRRTGPTGQPWTRRGSATYWKRQTSKQNLDAVWGILADSGRDGITQKGIAEKMALLQAQGNSTSGDSATVTRAITALWKLDELEFLGRERTPQGGTTIRWRLWEGEGKPPVPGQAKADSDEGTDA